MNSTGHIALGIAHTNDDLKLPRKYISLPSGAPTATQRQCVLLRPHTYQSLNSEFAILLGRKRGWVIERDIQYEGNQWEGDALGQGTSECKHVVTIPIYSCVGPLMMHYAQPHDEAAGRIQDLSNDVVAHDNATSYMDILNNPSEICTLATCNVAYQGIWCTLRWIVSAHLPPRCVT